MNTLGKIWRIFTLWVLAAFVMLVLYGMLMPVHASDLNKLKLAFTFDRAAVQQIIIIYYNECEDRGLVFDPAINKLEEVLTIKTPSLNCQNLKSILSDALGRAGVQIERKNTYDLIKKTSIADEKTTWQQIIYTPKFRDALELSDLSNIVVKRGSFAHQRKQIQLTEVTQQVPEAGQNGATLSGKPVDKLVFYGPESECAALLSLLNRLDTPNPQIEISAGIYEYQTGKNKGNALSAAISLLSGQLGGSITAGSSGSSSIKLNVPGIDILFSALDQDSRFKYVARPKVTVKDGELVQFFAGEDLRVTGALTIDKNGNPISSKETLSAGVRVEATPHIRGNVVDMSIYQAVSNFVASANGADPSILKRDLRTRLLMEPGSVYVIAGLNTARKNVSQQRFFGFSTSSSEEQSESEVLLLLTVKPDAVSL